MFEKSEGLESRLGEIVKSKLSAKMPHFFKFDFQHALERLLLQKSIKQFGIIL